MHHTATAFSTIFINEVVAVACCSAGNGSDDSSSALRGGVSCLILIPRVLKIRNNVNKIIIIINVEKNNVTLNDARLPGSRMIYFHQAKNLN